MAEIDRATACLRDLLALGPVPSGTVREKAETEGIAWRTVERAAQGLGVKAVTLWRLPSVPVSVPSERRPGAVVELTAKVPPVLGLTDERGRVRCDECAHSARLAPRNGLCPVGRHYVSDKNGRTARRMCGEFQPAPNAELFLGAARSLIWQGRLTEAADLADEAARLLRERAAGKRNTGGRR